MIASIISTIWWWSKHVLRWKSTLKGEARREKPFTFSFAGLLEAFVINCSDQQIFTGCAYAVTLRYVAGCTISAYHYDIVANMLLVTCATHLTAVTVSRNYWQDAIPAIVRIAITFVVYTVTGVLLSNQGAGAEGFPTKVPPTSDDYNDILLPAACFQIGEGGFTDTVQQSLVDANSFFKSKIPGWTQYLIMFIFYVLAVIVRIFSAIQAGKSKRKGHRRRIVDWTRRKFSFFFRDVPSRVLHLIFGLYLVAGNAVGIWTIYSSANYVVTLRNWVDQSHWYVHPVLPLPHPQRGTDTYIELPGFKIPVKQTPRITPTPLGSSSPCFSTCSSSSPFSSLSRSSLSSAGTGTWLGAISATAKWTRQRWQPENRWIRALMCVGAEKRWGKSARNQPSMSSCSLRWMVRSRIQMLSNQAWSGQQRMDQSRTRCGNPRLQREDDLERRSWELLEFIE